VRLSARVAPAVLALLLAGCTGATGGHSGSWVPAESWTGNDSTSGDTRFPANAVNPSPSAAPDYPAGTWGAGWYVVGRTIQVGTYVARGGGDGNCAFVLYSGASPTDAKMVALDSGVNTGFRSLRIIVRSQDRGLQLDGGCLLHYVGPVPYSVHGAERRRVAG
jgi:hypothetical protein